MQPPNVSSPTLATPRPSSLNLRPSASPAKHAEIPFYPNGQSETEINADRQDEERLENGIDGRITPTADSHSNPSRASSSSSSNLPSPNPTTISLSSQITSSTNPPPPSYTPTNGLNGSNPAEVGFGSAQAEEQLKGALQSKDRLFLLVLSKEFEAFIEKLVLNNGQLPSDMDNGTIQTPTTSTSLMASLTSSTNINVTPTSKFQRMLVYKTAEWYGLKAVPGQEGAMIVGVQSNLNDRSSSLRLSDLVPVAPNMEGQTQKFQIMRRAPTQGDASGSSSPAEGSTSSGGPKWKTMEEREAAYAAAREKIYGKSVDSDEAVEKAGVDGRQTVEPPAAVDDDIDPVPRQLYQRFEVIYPSLYHPPKVELNAPPPIPAPNPAMAETYPSPPSSVYSYQSSYPSYPQQMDPNGYSMMPQGYNHVPAMQAQQPQQSYGMTPQGYMDGNQNGYMIPPQPQQNGYSAPIGWQQPQNHNGYPSQMSPTYPPYGMQPQNSINGPSQAWVYSPQPQQQPMPMIPQGVPYGFPPPPPPKQHQRPSQFRQGSYPPLVQPTPVRPAIQPHSSASSSISSRSYQDGSRPHSRGSTTSTRSAASSVRLGAMYPANQGPGYRQRAMKGQGINGMTTLGLGGGTLGSEGRRNTRGHSPSSATTTSSRSSRRTSSIQLSAPTSAQHQLPQRPDWAANNVPYHPSPLPVPGSAGLNGFVNVPPSNVEFPPLLRQGQGTNAEPMQVERVKLKPPAGSVWNGNTVNTKQPTSHTHTNINTGNGSTGNEQKISILPGPSSRTPAPIPQQQQQQQETVDPDFPRRLPTKHQPVLYDPSAQTNSSSSHPHSRPSSVNTNKSTIANSTSNSVSTSNASAALSAEEIIEAKLAQISINNGIPIGSAPSTRDGGPGKSYAKVLRRD
ncbi:uncharacterized protein I303_104628 [Kwoniella dejecticola CBS 10117]|uniref:SUZ domain-containing protein n=1 Tax=Kwoniella dejecticola CBS 10117 TaxID=1296121 RepID=A0A1A6A4U9_9TREE|nr:uncharacterized protein I303_04393 [Kwoniella dejecticola CBS 10117]OBR85063.1 hypothetical protein I303_04393 [Kwoniella dejecticola CBS 10117]